jgi:outer membrane protein assembly factor BamB
MARSALWILLLAAPVGAATAATGQGDWPQLWGPQGDARATGPGGFGRAAALGSRELWRRPLGSGYSGLTIVKGRGYTGLSDGRQDVAVAFDADTGRELWRTPLGETYRGHGGSHDGPISTPAADGERVYVVGPRGVLVALQASDGKVAWRHDLVAELGAAVPSWGFATSPLLHGRNVIVQVGGAKQHQVVAFEAASGRMAWTAHHAAGANYVTPQLATIHGTPQLLTISSDKVLALSPADGTLLWSAPRPAEGEGSRPPLVLPDGRVLVHAWGEAAMVQVAREGDAFKATELWRSPRLRSSYSPTVFHDGWLYGYNDTYLVCLDPATGEVKWREKVYAGSLILVDGHLVLVGRTSGELRVAEASPHGYREKLRRPVFNPGAVSITGPSWAGGRLYLRNLEEMVALEVQS